MQGRRSILLLLPRFPPPAFPRGACYTRAAAARTRRTPWRRSVPERRHLRASTNSSKPIPRSKFRMLRSSDYSHFLMNTIGTSTTGRCATTDRSIPTCSATSSRSTSTRSRWAPITPKRTLLSTSRRIRSFHYLFDAAQERLCDRVPAGWRHCGGCSETIPTAISMRRPVRVSSFRYRQSIEAGRHDVSQRGDWNTPADPEYALPTETWREHVARRERYEEIWGKLVDGEVTSIDDLITYNLNIRQFAQDVIQQAEGPELVRAFFKAIRSISVLDPTCGSGAFLVCCAEYPGTAL